MAGDVPEHEAPTRREYVKYGGAVIGGGLLAGCTGESSPAGSGDTAESNGSDASTQARSGYAAAIEPVGGVEFDSVPEKWITHEFSLDMAVVCGTTDGIAETAWRPGEYVLSFYRMLPGVDVPNVAEMNGILGNGESMNKEYIYEVDPDMIGVDPNWLLQYSSGTGKDIEEIIDNVAPFCGSYNQRERDDSWPTWPDGKYRYYDLSAVTKYWGQVFDRPERGKAMAELNRSMAERIRSQVPETDETMGLLWAGPPDSGEIYIYKPTQGTKKVYGRKHFSDLQVNDALAGQYDGKTAIYVDAEVILEADPDKIVLHHGLMKNQLPASDAYDGNGTDGKTIAEYTLDLYRNDPVLSELTAVQNDELYIGTMETTGPIQGLFNTEVLAKQLYPETFGEFPGFDDDNTYDVPKGEQLFDRQRVADICNGNL